jgi:hypothetical protein
VIRHLKGAKAYAVLWRGREKLAFAEADNRKEAFDELNRLLGIRQQGLVESQGGSTPSAEQVANSFRFLWGYLNPGQQAMLRGLHRAPGRELSADVGHSDSARRNLCVHQLLPD